MNAAPVRASIPYTHSWHAFRCHLAAKENVILRQFVQVRMSGVGHCARLAEAWDTADGIEMWKVELLGPLRGLLSVAAGRVRQCSGLDGLCACAGETSGPADALRAASGPLFATGAGGAFSQAGVVAPPESPTYGTRAVFEQR